MSARITRRALLRSAGMAGGAALLAACQPTPTPIPAPTVVPTKAAQQATTVPATAVPATKVPPTAVPPTAVPKKVTVNWIGGFTPQYRLDYITKTLIPAYKDVAPNVEIVPVISTSWEDTEQRILVQSAAGGGPDLAQTYYAPLDFAARGIFAPLNPFLEADARLKPEVFYPALMRGGQYQGKTYGLPHNGYTLVFFYNKKHFAAAGLKEAPKTLDQVAEYAHKLTAVKQAAGIDYAIAMGSDIDSFLTYVYAYGGRFADDDCQRLFLDEKILGTIKWMLDLQKAGDASQAGTSASCSNGKAAMQIFNPITVGNTKNQFPDVYANLGAAVMPFQPGGSPGYCWAHFEHILATSKVKEQTWAYLSWMMGTPAIDLAFHKEQNYLPSQTSTLADPYYASEWAWAPFAQQLTTVKPQPTCTKWRAVVTEVVNPEMQAAWTGQKTAQQVMDAFTQKIPAILGIK